jgi:hypothetical protein
MGEPLPRMLINVRSQQPIGCRQARFDETAGQRRGHLAGADQSDPLLQHAFAVVRHKNRPFAIMLR